jgi:mannose-6-phosphate isomerase
MVWGGRKLARWAAESFPLEGAIGESWLLSDHPVHNSRVAHGSFQGVSIAELVQTRGEELLGQRASRFPLLIKLLDAREELSIQVHPDDEDARRWAPAEGGKTEAWLVLDAEPGSEICVGLKPGIDRAAVERELSRGRLPDCLQRYEPKPGQCYSIPAGTVHCVGGGVVLLEVQQTSDATFRLHDWGRVDAAGKPRPLHVEAGLACLKERPPGAGLVSPRKLADDAEALVDCPYFHLTRLRLSRPMAIAGPAIVVGLNGQAQVSVGGLSQDVREGELLLVPACVRDVRLAPSPDCHLALVEVK